MQGDLNDHESLVKAIKHVDVVISTVGFMQIGDQYKIIAAIKEAGNIKVCLPNLNLNILSATPTRINLISWCRGSCHRNSATILTDAVLWIQ